jgi:hypothetical protein
MSMWTSGTKVSCSSGWLSLARVEILWATGKDAHAGEVTGLMAGTSGRAGDVGFSVCVVALELEACFGTSGVLRKKKAS